MDATAALIWIANIILCIAGSVAIFGADREYWADPRTKFRIVILRALLINLNVAALCSLITGHWLLVGACGIEGLIVGAIGASLHPFMTWRDLRSGFRSANAQAEALSLPLEVKFALVDRACTQLTMLIFVDAIAFSIWAGWRWYKAAALISIVPTLIGGVLRFSFGSSRLKLAARRLLLSRVGGESND
jgi:hypothetical protein